MSSPATAANLGYKELLKMKFEQEQGRIKGLLVETITMLCKSGLTYRQDLKVQGLLGITVDDEHVFVVHIDEKYDPGFQKDLPLALMHNMPSTVEEEASALRNTTVSNMPESRNALEVMNAGSRAIHTGIPQQVMRDRPRNKLSRPSPYQHPKLDLLSASHRHSDSESPDIEVVSVTSEPVHNPTPPIQASAFQKSINYTIGGPDALLRPSLSGHTLSLPVNSTGAPTTSHHLAIPRRSLIALRGQGPGTPSVASSGSPPITHL